MDSWTELDFVTELDSRTDMDICVCMSCVPFTLVTNKPTRWRHLHQLETLAQDRATFFGYNVGHQFVPLVLITNLVTRWRQ